LQRDKLSSAIDRIAVLKQAINLADANRDIHWGFDLRLELIFEEKKTSRCKESLHAFTWILDAFDKHSGEFNEDDFLWEYKWMLGSVRRSVDVSPGLIEDIAEDYKNRLLRNGYSLRPYYSFRVHSAFFLDRLDEAAEMLEARNREMRDHMSNCRACELDDDVELEMRLGNFDKALAAGSEMLTKAVTCKHMPFSAYCTCMKYFARAGVYDKALEYFLKAENEFAEMIVSDETDTSCVVEISEMIHFLTGHDREKAWALFEQYVHWNIDSEDYYDLIFSMNVLPLLNDDNPRSLSVNTALPWYEEEGMYVPRVLYGHYHAKAIALAEKFDRRHDCDCFSKRLSLVIQ
jgi:pentatricopeptide repeat protein